MIITHRGLDPSLNNFYNESSKEAFENHLERGYGIEFDVRITRDRKFVISHDDNLSRISNGKCTKNISELTEKEILNFVFDGCHLITLDELLNLISNRQAKGAISAIHLKATAQNETSIDLLLSIASKYDVSKFIIFDVKINTAMYIKKHNPEFKLAPSVVHKFDKKRFNRFTGNTLFTTKEISKYLKLFSYAWLDEWDRIDEDEKEKKFYTKETLKYIYDFGLKTILVSPELHATSPELLGYEKHQDAENLMILEKRIYDLISLKPDYICTDYPDKVKLLYNKMLSL